MKRPIAFVALSLGVLGLHAQGGWTLRQCLEHALRNNIQIQKNRISEQEGETTLWQTKGALLPSLNFSTSHTLSYRPFQENTAIVQNGQVTNTSNKVAYNGSYGLNASMTLWNGGVNRKNIEAQKLQNQILETTTRQSELNIQEQIAQLYVQILYSEEARQVSQQLAQTAKSQYERGQQMQAQGQMSKADVSQLEAQWRSAEYDIVNSSTQVDNYKRQLKSLLQLPMETSFDLKGASPTDEQVMAALPASEQVYTQALATRPEIKGAALNVEAANLNLDIAKRGLYPTISLSASLGDSHYSGSSNSVGNQMKTNLNMSAGVNVSVPILDNRKTKSSIEKVKLAKVTSQLDLQEKKTTLSSTIEEYWLNANANQQKFVAARAKVQSLEASYELLDEQFKNGLKNIAELLQGRDNLVSAKQEELQSKYTTLLNLQLLKFYAGEVLEM